jgi:hypothetical protein
MLIALSSTKSNVGRGLRVTAAGSGAWLDAAAVEQVVGARNGLGSAKLVDGDSRKGGCLRSPGRDDESIIAVFRLFVSIWMLMRLA